jgi:DNA (cytosine-5)-methyltransferase 1
MKYRLLDLFCGAGGCSVGYYRAGFEVVGVDNKPQKHYPFEFHQADAMSYPLSGFAAIHASPPCQGYSRLRHLPWLKGRKWPLLIDPVRKMLKESGAAWIIENVEDAPLAGVILCGQMFGLPVYRHRKFESSFFIFTPEHQQHRFVIGKGRMINDRRKGTLNASSSRGAWGTKQPIVTVAGGQFKKADGERALGIDWMNKDELAQAIPPAYTEWIGQQLIGALKSGTCHLQTNHALNFAAAAPASQAQCSNASAGNQSNVGKQGLFKADVQGKIGPGDVLKMVCAMNSNL